MELWQVRKEYRRVAARFRRNAEPLEPNLQVLEAQLIVGIAMCDRYETELSVMRLARRCARARLKRLRQWVENAGLLKSSSLCLARKQDELAAEDLERALTRCSAPEVASTLRQVLDELMHLEQRLSETKARVGRIALLAAQSLQVLLTHARAMRRA